MQITINQDELEVAVRDYVAKQGISRTVGEINFTAVRSPSNQILTEIVLTDAAAPPAGAIPRAAPAITPDKPRAVAVQEVAEKAAPVKEAVKAADTEKAPFDEEGEEESQTPAGKSLFG